jgi:cell division protein FtsB
MIDVPAIQQLHREMTERWHQKPVDNPCHGFLGLVCQQCGFNFLLWHEEDIARSPDVSDSQIAQVKRAIDRYNQQRNDAIEKVDDWITEELARRGVTAPESAPMNTETPGSVIDRLSILALRIYHLREQAERPDATREHVASVERKLAVCLAQHEELSTALAQLISDIAAGRKRHRTYRMFKMYNDPTLNPYLYLAKGRKAG